MYCKFEEVSKEGQKQIPNVIEGFIKKGFKRENIYVSEYVEPKRATIFSAGSDVIYKGDKDIVIKPGDKVFIVTNVKAKMPPNVFLAFMVRSSQGMFKDVMLTNTMGVIDSDYYNNPSNEGNIGVGLRNLGDKDLVIKSGEAIGQAIFVPFIAPENESLSEKRVGGYGSTVK